MPGSIKRRRRSFWRDGRGVTSLEVAVTFPSFILLVVGMLDISRALWIKNSLQLAVAQAARCYAIDPTNCGSPSATQTYAGGQLNASGVTLASPNTNSSVFTATAGGVGCAGGHQVSAALTYNFIGIRQLPTSITLNAQACWPT